MDTYSLQRSKGFLLSYYDFIYKTLMTLSSTDTQLGARQLSDATFTILLSA